VLAGCGVASGMDGRGRWIDDVFIEESWRSLKYENSWLHAYADLTAARAGTGAWIGYHNGRRRGSFGRRTPDAVSAGDGQDQVPIARNVRGSGVLTREAAARAHLTKGDDGRDQRAQVWATGRSRRDTA
jgi:hypothetical protein